jgi:hypothetical protein
MLIRLATAADSHHGRLWSFEGLLLRAHPGAVEGMEAHPKTQEGL